MKRRTVLAKNPKALRSGIPPYTRHRKAPYLYSTGYREWFRKATKKSVAE